MRPTNPDRTHFRDASKAPWRRCGSHILPCMLRFFAAPRLALNPDPHFEMGSIGSFIKRSSLAVAHLSRDNPNAWS